MARRFGKEGRPVALVAHNRDRVAAAAKSLTDAGIKAQAFACDLSDAEAVRKMVGEVRGALEKYKAGTQVRHVEAVGGSVSRELFVNGMLALGLSLVAMLAYIWFRFEWQFGVGAVITLVLDVTKVVGFYVITGFQFNLTAIAAIRTIMGYSINDKVVVYDRMRENLRKLGTFDVCWGVGSAEGLQRKMEGTESGLLLCLDEFKQFVSKCKIDASVLLPCVNTLFESNRYESRTKTSNIELTGAYLSLLAASTVETHKRTWDSSFTDIGFTNRLFLVPGTAVRKYSFPEKISENDKQSLRTQVSRIIEHVGKFTELELSQAGRENYHNWYLNVESSIHAKRLDVYALRLMALLAVNDLKGEVDPRCASSRSASPTRSSSTRRGPGRSRC